LERVDKDKGENALKLTQRGHAIERGFVTRPEGGRKKSEKPGKSALVRRMNEKECNFQSFCPATRSRKNPTGSRERSRGNLFCAGSKKKRSPGIKGKGPTSLMKGFRRNLDGEGSSFRRKLFAREEKVETRRKMSNRLANPNPQASIGEPAKNPEAKSSNESGKFCVNSRVRIEKGEPPTALCKEVLFEGLCQRKKTQAEGREDRGAPVSRKHAGRGTRLGVGEKKDCKGRRSPRIHRVLILNEKGRGSSRRVRSRGSRRKSPAPGKNFGFRRGEWFREKKEERDSRKKKKKKSHPDENGKREKSPGRRKIY